MTKYRLWPSLGPLRVDVLAHAEHGHGLDLSAGRIDQPEPVVAVAESGQVSRESVGHERDRAAIGRPGRLQVRVEVGGQTAQLFGLDIEDEQVRVSIHDRGEHHAPTVGRERGRVDLAQFREPDLLHLLARLGLDDRQRGTTLDDDPEGEVLPVGAPRARRVDELEALEVRVHGRLGETTDGLARLCVRQEHLDGEQILLREKHDPRAVRADRRPNVQPAPAHLLRDQLGRVAVLR